MTATELKRHDCDFKKSKGPNSIYYNKYPKYVCVRKSSSQTYDPAPSHQVSEYETKTINLIN